FRSRPRKVTLDFSFGSMNGREWTRSMKRTASDGIDSFVASRRKSEAGSTRTYRRVTGSSNRSPQRSSWMYSRYSTSWMSRFLGIGLTAINPHPLVKQPGRLQVSQRCRGHPVFLLSGRRLLTHSGSLIFIGADGYLVDAPIVAAHPCRPAVEDVTLVPGGGGLLGQLLDAAMQRRQVDDLIPRHLFHQIACPFDIAVQVVPSVHSFIGIVV